MPTSELRPRRQITIPAEVCSAAGLAEKDIVEWTFEGGEIKGRKLIRPPGAPKPKLVKEGGFLVVDIGRPFDMRELNRELEDYL